MHSCNLAFAARPKDGAAWSDIYISTCLTWVTLSGALHPVSIAIKVIEVLNPPTTKRCSTWGASLLGSIIGGWQFRFAKMKRLGGIGVPTWGKKG